MYIQDTVPFSDYCLVMCIGAQSSQFYQIQRKKNQPNSIAHFAVPMFVIGTTEVQFFAYLQLIRNRLVHLNGIIAKLEDQKYSPTQILGIETNKKTTSSSLVNNGNIFNKWRSKHRHSRNQHAVCLTTAMESIQIQETSKEKKGFELLKIIQSRKKIHQASVEQYAQNSDYTDDIVTAQRIYMKLEKVSLLINSFYGTPIIFILAIKFTTLTSLLYFCCMIIIK